MSAIDEAEADEQIAEALRSYNIPDVDSVAVRRALVERSGMLQESSEQRIEFLHNTLKEFLAAERFANMGEFRMMADNAAEESWQPVILFAVALPRDGSSFATDLVRVILKQTPLDAPPTGRSKQARENAAKLRSRQFFFFRCYTTAYQLNDSELTTAFDELSQHLLPPRNMTDAEALATCGESVVPYLANREGMNASQRAACVRTLGLIGGSRARTYLETYFEDTTETVRRELANQGENVLTVPSVMRSIEQLGSVPSWAIEKVSDVSPLASLTHLTSLKLTSLDLRNTQVSDVSPLASLTNLTSLDLSSTQVSDVSPLASLTNLTSLNLTNTQVSDVSPLASLTKLTSLYLPKTRVSGIDKFKAAVPKCRVYEF
ncbi:leucine-rich repeat domain-containing protein [Candidatus Poribacteria bacterium]|nr:leucine-rich repeat domain-containing protein [Candidatus Poribacteria bacterium]